MAIQVENNLKQTASSEFQQLTHYLPCKIEHDGSANVEKYFQPCTCEDDNNEFTATFRGYPLDGKKLLVPGGYTAVKVTETKKPLAENADRKFQVVGGFKDIVYWNWDKKPSKNDNFVKAMDWIDVAEAIHGE